MRCIIAVLLLSVLISITLVAASAKYHHGVKSRGYRHRRQDDSGRKDTSKAATWLHPPSCHYKSHQKTFDIMSFGARGDGVTDDSNALLTAWKAACAIPAATIRIPSEFKFLMGPVTLKGPCMPNLVLQIDGTILASSNPRDWSKSTLLQWINLKWFNNFTVTGNGMVDGQGAVWWNTTELHHPKKIAKHMWNTRPTALRFYRSCNVTVRDIRILNSPQCHLKFDSCEGIKVTNINVFSPGNSPNTDGIHIQNTQDVEIEHSDIGSGDDCISIQEGCSNVHIHHINCTPGHGISLGGLGKDNSLACVSNITVEKVSIQNALYGVRIKTWQGGIGSVHNVTFSDIQVSEVETPIVIDQYYCTKKFCRNQTDAVTISTVKYEQIMGTYSFQPMHIACSDRNPCTNIDLIDIHLSPSSVSGNLQEALCWKSYGDTHGILLPNEVNCLQKGNKLLRFLDKSHKYNC